MRAKGIAVASFLAAVVGALVVLVVPLGSWCSISSVGGSERCGTSRIIADEGWGILLVLAVPILIALVPVLARGRGVSALAAVLLWICCLLGLLSIGIFFVPAAVLMTVAAARREPVPAPVG
jgi:hypothetical protein